MSHTIRMTCTMPEAMTGQLTPPRHDSGSSRIRSMRSSKIPRQKPSLRTFLPRKRYTPDHVRDRCRETPGLRFSKAVDLRFRRPAVDSEAADGSAFLAGQRRAHRDLLRER